ncbi:hypothetical protein TNCV_1036531 [Trichonephila clavipes]|nr:hypothetical protein TNCV_1036531 [Trichonephila clavipes]
MREDACVRTCQPDYIWSEKLKDWVLLTRRFPGNSKLSGDLIFRRVLDTCLKEQGNGMKLEKVSGKTEQERLDIVELKTSVVETTRMGGFLFRDDSKCTKQSDSRRVFTWREIETCFYPPT